MASHAYPSGRAHRVQLDGHRRLSAEERQLPFCTRCGVRFARQLTELWCRPCIRAVVEAADVELRLVFPRGEL